MRLLEVSEDSVERSFEAVRKKHRGKFQRLMERVKKTQSCTRPGFETGHVKSKGKWVVNLSSRELTEGEKKILEKDTKFAPAQGNSMTRNYIRSGRCFKKNQSEGKSVNCKLCTESKISEI